MSLPTADTALRWRGRTVRDAQGEKLGRLGALYLDGHDRPAYGGVTTGVLGRKESIVPLNNAREDEDGDVHLAVAGELVRGAPSLDPDAALTEGEEHELERHYRVQPEPGTIVRSEEEVTAAAEPMAPQERVRLRKVLVTEEVTQVVPVRKEIVQLETDPPPEGHIESVEDVGEAPPDTAPRGG